MDVPCSFTVIYSIIIIDFITNIIIYLQYSFSVHHSFTRFTCIIMDLGLYKVKLYGQVALFLC